MRKPGRALGRGTFGECYFVDPDHVDRLIAQRVLGDPPWRYTDDTEMARSLVSHLRQYGRVDQDRLVECFARRYSPNRGYGPAMHGYLDWIRRSIEWRAS